MKKTYLVTWKIDIVADNAIEAAMQSVMIMQDKESTALCFEVTKENRYGNINSDKTEKIDLSEVDFSVIENI